MDKPVKKRKDEIILLNVLFCLLVIFIHASSAPVAELERDSLAFFAVFVPWRLAGFVVQGFLLLSGVKLFLNRGEKIRYGAYYLARLRTVVLPYIAWVAVYYLYFWSHDYFAFELPALVRYLCVGDLAGHFYFVIIIVQFYLLVPLWNKLFRAVPPWLAIGLSFLVNLFAVQWLPDIWYRISPNGLFVYNDRLLTTYLFFWTAGCYAGLYYRQFLSLLRRIRWWLAAGVAIFGGLDLYFFYGYLQGSIFRWTESLRLGYCVCAVLFCYACAAWWSDGRTVKNRLLLRVDRVSYPIYLMHCLVIFILNDWMARWGISRIDTAYAIRLAGAYGISIGLCCVYGVVKQRLERSLRTQ